MSIETTILLGAGPQVARQGLKALKDDVTLTGAQNASGQKAFFYKQMSTQTWQLLGATSQKSGADRARDFCDQHIPLLERYQNLLALMHQELCEQSAALVSASSTQNMFELLEGLQDDVRSRVRTMVTYLNTFDNSSGYLFSGAQNDQAGINEQLVPDLCAAGAPDLTLGNLDQYFLNGETPNVQMPLTLLFEANTTLDLPLCANDMQDVFQVFYDILSLEDDNAREGVQAMQSALDPALQRLKAAMLRTSDLINTFSGHDSWAGEIQTETQNEIDLLTETDSFEGALAFYDASKALESYLQFIIFMNAGSQKLREMTTQAML